MKGPFSINTLAVAIAIGVIVVSTVTLSLFSYYYTVGRENLAETSLVQSNIKLATQYIDRIEQKIIDNDRTLSEMIDVNNPSQWPAMVEAVKSADLNVEQVYFLRPQNDVPVFPSWSYEIRNAWGAFRASFKMRELDIVGLAVNQTHHLHRERPDNYFFASYVLKETAKGEKILVCFQMNFGKCVALLDKYLRDLQPNFYVCVVDFENNGVYNQPISRTSKYFYEARFPSTFYKWILQVVPRNYTEIEGEVRNQRRTNLFFIMLSMTLIFTSLGIIYVAGRRERQLRRLKENFIANVSHELKTPLSLIGMFSELLETDRVKDKGARQEYYRIIRSEAERMNRLVSNLLDFASLERGEREKRFEMLNVAVLVHSELEAFRHQIQKEGFRLSADLDMGVPETLAEPTYISMALFNLLDNSLKYFGERKQVEVKVSQNDGYIEVAVADDGPGIPAEEQQKIFEKFYRGSSAAVRKTRGSGIGLSITKHVAEIHQGQVLVRSEEGQGSVFTLRIPIRRGAESRSDG